MLSHNTFDWELAANLSNREKIHRDDIFASFLIYVKLNRNLFNSNPEFYYLFVTRNGSFFITYPKLDQFLIINLRSASKKKESG